MDTQITALLQRAATDEETLQSAGLPEVPFGQHAQAAVEKLLKALIHARGQRYPLTHNSTILMGDLARLSEPLPTFPIPLGGLTAYAMILRYEDDDHQPPPLDRRACIEAVELLRDHVTGRIKAFQPPLAAGPDAAP